MKRGQKMAGIIKFVINVLIVVILAAALYVVGLMFQIVPVSFTPQELLQPQYAQLKENLAKNVAAKGATAGMSQSLLNFLNGVEAGYKQPTAAAAVSPAAPMEPGVMPGAAAPAPTTMPGETAPAPTTMPGAAPTTMPGTMAPAPTTAPATAAPAPGTAAPTTMPGTMAPAPTTAPGTAAPTTMPATTAPPGVAPTQPAAQPDATTKASQTVQQYQSSVDQEKKTLDSL